MSERTPPTAEQLASWRENAEAWMDDKTSRGTLATRVVALIDELAARSAALPETPSAATNRKTAIVERVRSEVSEPFDVVTVARGIADWWDGDTTSPIVPVPTPAMEALTTALATGSESTDARLAELAKVARAAMPADRSYWTDAMHTLAMALDAIEIVDARAASATLPRTGEVDAIPVAGHELPDRPDPDR